MELVEIAKRVFVAGYCDKAGYDEALKAFGFLSRRDIQTVETIGNIAARGNKWPQEGLASIS